MKNMIKDAAVLFVITLFAGLILGVVYQVTKEECERCVLDALKAGYRSINMAQSYFNEEEDCLRMPR